MRGPDDTGRPRGRAREVSAGRTIAAPATALGPAGVSVLRVSGPEAHAVVRRVCPTLPPDPGFRRMVLRPVVHPETGAVLDEALVVLFEAGRSFTGEAAAELHGHGGAAQTRALFDALVAAGAHPAGPGEFTRRAVAAGRIDLARAEGIAEVTAAASEAGLAAARSLMGGALSRRIEAFLAEVEALLAEWEAFLDFPEEAGDVDPDGWPPRLEALLGEVRALVATHARGRRLRDGARVVLVGPPNAGKSSLLNRLAGYERALVDAAPGTTRDQVEAHLEVGGIAVTLVDGAGVREGGDRVERQGIARTLEAVSGADLVLAVFDGSRPPAEDAAAVARALEGAGARTVLVLNKRDLGAAGHGALAALLPEAERLATSAVTGAGLTELASALESRLALGPVGEGEVVVLLARHAEALAEAAGALEAGLGLAREGVLLDAGAEELRHARRALASVLGRGALPDAILDRIFARFCVGK